MNIPKKHFLREPQRCLYFSLILVVTGMTLSGCSAIGREEAWTADIKNTDWARLQSHSEVHLKFQHRDIVISVRCRECEGRNYHVIWMGPTPVPIFPLFRKPIQFHRWSLESSLKIQNPNNAVTIDFSEAEIQTSNGKSLPLLSLREAGDYTSYSHIPTKFLEILEKKVVSYGIVDFSLIFPPFDSATEEGEFVINFGSMDINGEKIIIPPLRYHKAVEYNYIAIGFPEHGIP